MANVVYPSNSNLSKSKPQEPASPPEPKKIECVVRGKVHRRQDNRFTKLLALFLPTDIEDIPGHILKDVLIPQVRDGLFDIVKTCLYGGSAPGNRKSSPASRVSYRSYWDGPRDRTEERPAQRSAYTYDDIFFDNRGEAEDVLVRMCELLDQYQIVTVADLYDLVGETGSYTDNRYGWTDISMAKVEYCREGYYIHLPRPMPIN